MAAQGSRQSEVQGEEGRRDLGKLSVDVQLPTAAAYALRWKSTSAFQRSEINSQARRLDRISNRDVTRKSCVRGERSGGGDLDRGNHLIEMASTATGPGPRLRMLKVCWPGVTLACLSEHFQTGSWL
jgi:hypothetical protein